MIPEEKNSPQVSQVKNHSSQFESASQKGMIKHYGGGKMCPQIAVVQILREKF